jgi:hypothetical protein
MGHGRDVHGKAEVVVVMMCVDFQHPMLVNWQSHVNTVVCILSGNPTLLRGSVPGTHPHSILSYVSMSTCEMYSSLYIL